MAVNAVTVPLVPSGWILEKDDPVWRLTDPEGHRLRIDFDDPGPDYRRKAPRGLRELLPRALGASSGIRQVVDLSAGLGQDAVFLAQLGFSVVALERHPVIGFLLQEALKASQRPELERLQFEIVSASDWLRDSRKTAGIEAAYFDPMYPVKKKSALPRQEMVLFRSLAGDDGDAAETANAAFEVFRRLVVKRPLHGQPLKPNPTSMVKGTTVRYDVYTR